MQNVGSSIGFVPYIAYYEQQVSVIDIYDVNDASENPMKHLTAIFLSLLFFQQY